MSYAQSTTPSTPFDDRATLRGGSQREGLVHAVIAAGALAAWADGKVHPVERLEMLVYMRHPGLPRLRRREVLDVLDMRVRLLERDPAPGLSTLQRLFQDFTDSPWAPMVLGAAEHVAAADGQIQEPEVTAIRFVRMVLGQPEDAPDCRPPV